MMLAPRAPLAASRRSRGCALDRFTGGRLVISFIPVDPGTLQATAKPNVFALGDATEVPTSKAGSVARFEGDVLVGNIRRFLAGQPLAGTFDGHTNCFIETGFGKAPQIAAAAGIDELTPRHWQVIRFMRAEYEVKGTGPTVRVLGKTSGVSIKELYQLFPKGPAKTAAKIAGIPKPRGCI